MQLRRRKRRTRSRVFCVHHAFPLGISASACILSIPVLYHAKRSIYTALGLKTAAWALRALVCAKRRS